MNETDLLSGGPFYCMSGAVEMALGPMLEALARLRYSIGVVFSQRLKAR